LDAGVVSLGALYMTVLITSVEKNERRAEEHLTPELALLGERASPRSSGYSRSD
jgi:hypothetical protein